MSHCLKLVRCLNSFAVTNMKVDEYVQWKTCRGLIASGIIFMIVDELTLLVDTGSGGGRGLEYVKIKDII